MQNAFPRSVFLVLPLGLATGLFALPFCSEISTWRALTKLAKNRGQWAQASPERQEWSRSTGGGGCN
jgi:hypothetical protein